ncbi:uncharacterized protein LOC132200389 [Neocloeon triangulifer]|uniref:uncharacterized protein LOC132200389 n=1 Tax=Neocloeon triangulifer TaxID=2078957 RepID=UPI00286EE903|nr:uncharacterized protein LOC132200389 [Neocloeon triangulifer]
MRSLSIFLLIAAVSTAGCLATQQQRQKAKGGNSQGIKPQVGQGKKRQNLVQQQTNKVANGKLGNNKKIQNPKRASVENQAGKNNVAPGRSILTNQALNLNKAGVSNKLAKSSSGLAAGRALAGVALMPAVIGSDQVEEQGFSSGGQPEVDPVPSQMVKPEVTHCMMPFMPFTGGNFMPIMGLPHLFPPDLQMPDYFPQVMPPLPPFGLDGDPNFQNLIHVLPTPGNEKDITVGGKETASFDSNFVAGDGQEVKAL